MIFMSETKDNFTPEVLDSFLRYHRNVKDHSEGTISDYDFIMRSFLRFVVAVRNGATSPEQYDQASLRSVDADFIGDIKKSEIYNYLDYLREQRENSRAASKKGLSVATMNQHLACIRSFYDYHVARAGTIPSDPTSGIDMAKIPKHMPKYLTVSESDRLLRKVEERKGLNMERDYAIIYLFVTCGLRISELVGMDVQDIRQSEDMNFVVIRGKGNKERKVFLNDECMKCINEYLNVRVEKYTPNKASENALFLSKHHNRISADAVQLLVKNYMLNAGLPAYSPHKLRHTSATIMMERGIDVRTIQEVLGHASLNTTEIYTHVTGAGLRDAVNAVSWALNTQKDRD